MWPFTKKREKNGVSKPVENPALKAAFAKHRKERTGISADELGIALNSASFLVPIVSDEMKVTPEVGGKFTIEKGSLIKFMNCHNDRGETFLPAFTDWNELRSWAGNEADSFVMPSPELWEFVLNNSNYLGIAINPTSDAWTLLSQNIRTLIDES